MVLGMTHFTMGVKLAETTTFTVLPGLLFEIQVLVTVTSADGIPARF